MDIYFEETEKGGVREGINLKIIGTEEVFSDILGRMFEGTTLT